MRNLKRYIFIVAILFLFPILAWGQSSSTMARDDGGNFGIGTTMTVGGLSIMSGNTGIGTWSPTQMLQVVGTVAATAFSGDGTGLIGIGWTDGGTNVYTATTTDNVGIGTTTPSSALTIAGNLSVGTTTPYRTITGPGNGIAAEGNVGIGTWAASNGKLIIMGGNVGVGTATPVGALTVINGNVGIGTWSPTQRLQVVGTVAATAFTGDGSGLTGISAGGWTAGGTNVYTSTTTDNVGIGTTSPNAATLEIVKNAAQPPLKVSSTASGGGNFLLVSSTGNVGLGTTAPVGALAVMNGNVGFGTWSPTQKLEVNGAGKFTGSGDSYLNSNSGNVGIGTASPSGFKLDVNGKIRSTSTTDIGWSVVNAANQACNTTCTSACVVGIDTSGAGGFLACTDATADSCLCAGAS